MEKLESESQIANYQMPGSDPLGVQAPATVDDNDAPDEVLPPHVRALIERCMIGSEPYGRELKPQEVQKFGPQHIQMVLMRSSGLQLTEIASLLDVTPVTVGNACRHPYGRKIIYEMMHREGALVVDIRKRIETFAGELLTHTFALALAEEDVEKVSKVTFNLLDRAGYAAKGAGATGVHKEGLEDHSALSRLANALDESSAADRVTYNYRQVPAPDVGRADLDSTPGSRSVAIVAPLRGGLASSGPRDSDIALDGQISDDPSVVAIIDGHSIRKASHG